MRTVAVALFLAGCAATPVGAAPVVPPAGAKPVDDDGVPPRVPPFRDGALVTRHDDKQLTVTTALAYRAHAQEAIRLVLTPDPLRCEDLFLLSDGYGVRSKNGVPPDRTTRLYVAPVLVDVIPTNKGFVLTRTPREESWRVTEDHGGLTPEGGIGNVSSVEIARDAATKGKTSTVRIALANAEGAGVSGSLSVIGCGEAGSEHEARSFSDLDLRVGEHRVPVRGARYRKDKGKWFVELTTGAAGCDGTDGSDTRVFIEAGLVTIMGDRYPMALVTAHALELDIGPLNVGSMAKITVRGSMHKPGPNAARIRHTRDLHIAGHFEALVCPDITW